MQKLRTFSSERTIDIPVYCAPEKDNNEKSCFIDENRIDTIKLQKEIAKKCKKQR